MPKESCILTTKDFTILEVMLDRCLGRDDPLAPLLRRKIGTALVVFRDDVPPDVATMSSRVTFNVDGREPDTRIVSHDRMTSPIGLFLPVTMPRGLALLGLSEGQSFRLENHDGAEETITLEKVHYQPETARREKEAMERLATPTPGKPMLRLVRGAGEERPRLLPAGADGFDDPGPEAA